jgi:hypothetical protein
MVYFPPFRICSICFFAFLMGLPQTVHLVFSKNCGLPHRLFSHRIMSDFPQASQFSLPAKVAPPQMGQAVMSGLPHPEHTTLPRSMGFRQVGHW